MNCPNCHQPNAVTARFCPDCETPLPTSTDRTRIGAIAVDAMGDSSVIQVGVPQGVPGSEHCPICGAYNLPDKTFGCKQCGRAFICREHQDKATDWCRECVAAEQTRFEAERNPAGLEWVEAPAGPFLYGDDKERAHIATPYLIGKYPVTQAQYQRFIDANPAVEVPFVDADRAKPYNWNQRTRRHPADRSSHPVVLVTWHDAVAFCQWAKCRLPTEQEWERAARGPSTGSGDGRIYPWGNDWVNGKYCNSREAGIGGTTTVEAYPLGVSPAGAWDMAGNVWEWTDSLYDNTNSYRVLRGGSWGYEATVVRAAYRLWLFPVGRGVGGGFRCAR